MNVILFVFLTVCIRAKSFSSIGSANGPSVNDDNYAQELNEGYELLKGEPHAKDTKWLLQQLHKMEPEIEQELTLSPEREAELQEEMNPL